MHPPQSPHPLVLLAVLLIGLILVSGFVFLALRDWKKKLPKEVIHGFHVRRMPGVDSVWRGLDETLKEILGAISADYGVPATNAIFPCIIEVHPSDGILHETSIPGKRGYNGITEQERFLGLFAKRYICKTRQLKQPEGPGIRPAHESALAHEVIEHAFPHSAFRDWNLGADVKPEAQAPLSSKLRKMKLEANAKAKEALGIA